MNIELWKDAISVIDGIPEKRINLNTWQKSQLVRFITGPDQIECGTICCAAGWLALHPKFQSLGLKTDFNLRCPVFVDSLLGVCTGYRALAAMFGISHREAEETFKPNSSDKRPDKQVWLERAKDLLRKYS